MRLLCCSVVLWRRGVVLWLHDSRGQQQHPAVLGSPEAAQPRLGPCYGYEPCCTQGYGPCCTQGYGSFCTQGYGPWGRILETSCDILSQHYEISARRVSWLVVGASIQVKYSMIRENKREIIKKFIEQTISHDSVPRKPIMI